MSNRKLNYVVQHPYVSKLLVAVKFNADITGPEGSERYEEIYVALAMVGLKDILEHFLLLRRPWAQEFRMWSMVHMGRKVRYQKHYILETDFRIFRNVSV